MTTKQIIKILRKPLGLMRSKARSVLRDVFHLPLARYLIDSGSETVLAITRSDYECIGSFRLMRLGRHISTILALDQDAIGVALDRNMPFTICEDFMNDEELEQICSQINYYSSHCLDNIKEVTIDGINYAKLDRINFFHLFHELLFSKALAEKILADGKKVIAIKEISDRKYEYYGSNRFADATSMLDPESITLLPFSLKPLWKSVYTEWDTGIDIRNKIVVVLNSAEIERHEEIILNLLHHFPEKVCIFCTSGNYTGKLHQIPIYSTPIHTNSMRDDSFIPILKHSDDEYIVDKTIIPHFKEILNFHCHWRWPNIHQAFLQFKSILQTQRPLCVMGTTLNDAEAQIAIIAAKQLNIKTYAWQHALTHGIFPEYRAETVFLGSKFATALAGNDERKRFIAVNNYDIMTPLYKFRNTSRCEWNSQGRFKILVLPPVCRINHSPGLFNNLKNSNTHIEDILSIPTWLKNRVSIRFKAHPGYSATSYWKSKHPNLSELFFPHTAHLCELLDMADCCLLLGEIGCALVHASMRVPTFYCETNFYLCPQDRQSMKKYPHYYTHIYPIWSVIESLINEPELKNTFLERQKSWTAYDASYPTMAEILKNDLCL